MEQYRFHKTHIYKKISEMISDTVDSPPKQFNIQKMSSKDATFHTTQDLIFALQNQEPEKPLVKPGNWHKEALRNLA